MIRAATPQDARAIAEIQVRGWQWAYGDILPPERIASITYLADRGAATPELPPRRGG